jgi:hypothetical protein
MHHATVLQDTKEALYPLQLPQLHQDSITTFIYSYKLYTDQLQRTSILTREQSIHHIPSYKFKEGYLSEVPGGSLLITGGGNPAVREVVTTTVALSTALGYQEQFVVMR